MFGTWNKAEICQVLVLLGVVMWLSSGQWDASRNNMWQLSRNPLLLLFPIPVGWNSNVMARAMAATWDHEMILGMEAMHLRVTGKKLCFTALQCTTLSQSYYTHHFWQRPKLLLCLSHCCFGLLCYSRPNLILTLQLLSLEFSSRLWALETEDWFLIIFTFLVPFLQTVFMYEIEFTLTLTGLVLFCKWSLGPTE